MPNQTTGLVITSIANNSPFKNTTLSVDDIILEAQKKRIKSVDDLRDITKQDRFQSSKNISLLKRSESFSITYDEIDYVIEIIEEGDGTFTSVEYDGNYLMDARLEKDILDYFNKYK